MNRIGTIQTGSRNSKKVRSLVKDLIIKRLEFRVTLNATHYIVIDTSLIKRSNIVPKKKKK